MWRRLARYGGRPEPSALNVIGKSLKLIRQSVGSQCRCQNSASADLKETRMAFGRAIIPLTKVFPRLVVNKTIIKPHLAAATGGQHLYMGFSRRDKIPHCSTYTISEKAIRFRHPDYNTDLAQKLIVRPCPDIVDMQHFIQIHAHLF